MKNLISTELQQVAGGATSLGLDTNVVITHGVDNDTLSIPFTQPSDLTDIISGVVATLMAPNTDTFIATSGNTDIGNNLPVAGMEIQLS